MSCTIEDLTVDADVHGRIIEIESFDGEGKEYIAAQFREPIITSLFCSNCGYIFEGGIPDMGINRVVTEHLEESKNA